MSGQIFYDPGINIWYEVGKGTVQYDQVRIKSIDQIINFSILNSKKLVALLDEQNVFLSTKSACSSSDESSKVIMELYKDDKRASNSIRISLSYTTTKKEIKKFKEIFKECYEKLGD